MPNRVSAGITASSRVGLSFGWLHAASTNAFLHDTTHPEPGLAAVLPFYGGILAGIIAVPIIASPFYWLALRGGPWAGALGWLALVGSCAAGWFVAYSLSS